MKKLIIAASIMCIVSCNKANRIAVQYNYRAPLHWEKYEEVNGKILVHGRPVKLIEGTCIYAKSK